MDWQIEIVEDGKDHAAFGRAIELGDDDAGDAGGIAEALGLLDGVLARGAIKHEQDFVRRVRHNLARDLADFCQLSHQIVIVLQAASGINDEDFVAPRFGGDGGVVDDGAGVGAWTVGDDGHINPLPPGLQLLDGGGAEGIAGRDHDLAP